MGELRGYFKSPLKRLTKICSLIVCMEFPKFPPQCDEPPAVCLLGYDLSVKTDALSTG